MIAASPDRWHIDGIPVSGPAHIVGWGFERGPTIVVVKYDGRGRGWLRCVRRIEPTALQLWHISYFKTRGAAAAVERVEMKKPEEVPMYMVSVCNLSPQLPPCIDHEFSERARAEEFALAIALAMPPKTRGKPPEHWALVYARVQREDLRVGCREWFGYMSVDPGGEIVRNEPIADGYGAPA